jgi:hypothetical protein
MNQHRPFPDDEIDRLVRSHLVQQEETVDAARFLAGVRARLSAWGDQDQRSTTHASRSTQQRRPRIGLRLAVAAAVLLVVLLSVQVGPNSVNATTLVLGAQKVHALPVDRCYLVQTEVAADVVENYQLLPVMREAHLWTRGDRFWMETPRPDHKGGWGRDEKGRVWFAAPHRKAGFRFEADEVPRALHIACGLRSMRVETLLKQLLVDFELQEAPPQDGPRGPLRVVQATLKPGRQLPLRAVNIEMDNRNVLQRVVLSRTYKEAVSTVTFTLLQEDFQPDDIYRLENHLEPDARIFSKDEPPPRRMQMLRRQYEMTRPEKGTVPLPSKEQQPLVPKLEFGNERLPPFPASQKSP